MLIVLSMLAAYLKVHLLNAIIIQYPCNTKQH